MTVFSAGIRRLGQRARRGDLEPDVAHEDVSGNGVERCRQAGSSRIHVANCLIFHNVCPQTGILHELVEEGHVFDDETLSRLSPYITERVNRAAV